MILMEAFHAQGKTPTRNTVNTVISRQNDKIERVFSGRMENPVFRLKRAYIEEHEDEFPTPEEIADHAAHQVAEALGTIDMPLVPKDLAAEIRTRLARFSINGKFTIHDFQMEQKAVQDLVMADRDNWLGLRKVWLAIETSVFFHWHLTLCKSSPKASDCELEKWIKKVDKEISRYDLTEHQRETTLFDIGHKNDDLMGLAKNYRYFYLKHIHTPRLDLAQTGRHHDFLGEPISQGGLPAQQGGTAMNIYLSNLLNFGQSGLVTTKYDHFTRETSSGQTVVCKYLQCNQPSPISNIHHFRRQSDIYLGDIPKGERPPCKAHGSHQDCYDTRAILVSSEVWSGVQ